MYNILKLNAISDKIKFSFDSKYEFPKECSNPDAILLRSFNMADYVVGRKLLAIGRAGAGVNNIPHQSYIEKGVVVFNTPGANANAVKELVLASLLLSCRDIVGGIEWVKGQKAQGVDVTAVVEKGKAKFVGPEISGKVLGIIGLGAIGTLVAESAFALGMNVYGYDPYISPQNAEKLGGKATILDSIEKLYEISDFITIHVPYLPSTKGSINKDAIAKMKDGVHIINLARGELVVNADIIESLKNGKVAKYIVDFPTNELLDVEGVIATPHLGASTPEAEDNCAVMVANQVADYIENGNISNSVNFPALSAPRAAAKRICILAGGIQDVLTTINCRLAQNKIVVAGINSAARGNSAYIIVDTDSDIPKAFINQIIEIPSVFRVRVI